MTQEEKNLLLKDLCARLPYGVKISVQSWDEEEQVFVDKVDVLYSVNKDRYIKSANEDHEFSIEDVKPYLLPMSSMTEEQRNEFHELLCDAKHGIDIDYFDWCHKNNLDCRRFIPMGFAIDATGLNIY